MIAQRRRVSFVLLVCLLLAALPPLIGGGALAQNTVPAGDFTPAHPEGPPLDIPPLNTPIPGPGVVPIHLPTPTLVPIFPTEEPEPTPVPPAPNNPNPPAPDIPDPTAVPVIPIEITPPVIPALDDDEPLLRPATFTIRARVCDNERFDPYANHELEAMEAECPLVTDAFGFSMQTSSLALSKVTSGGVVTFSAPAMTTVSIQGVRPEGYDMPVYTCFSASKSRIWSAETRMILPMAWETSPAEDVQCTWFFVQDNKNINLRLGKLPCASFAPETLTSETVYCEGGDWEMAVWGEVTLSDTDPATPDFVYPGGGRQLSFIDLPPGTYTITETNVPAGAAWSYWGHCFIADPASGDHEPIFPLVKGETFTLVLDQLGDTVSCNSYNVAGPAGASTPAAIFQGPWRVLRATRIGHAFTP